MAEIEETLVPLVNPSFAHIGLNNKSSRTKAKPIGVIGTGNFAVAITKRLVFAGYDVVMGSRRPLNRQNTFEERSCLCGAELTSIPETIRRCDVIVIAIHMDNFKFTLAKYRNECQDKLLIDVSNRDYRYAQISNAEYLQNILPEAVVAKAFNTVSAHAMEEYSDSVSSGSQRVFVASDNPDARATLRELATSLGFTVLDMGGLRSARYMEEFVLKVFSHWKVPIFSTFLIFNMWTLYIIYIYFIDDSAYSWEQIFFKLFNKPLCMTGMTVLALTYLPGQLASAIQLIRGTKHRPFHSFLDTWLKSRKQLGLISFTLISLHVIASVAMLSPTYYRSWFHVSKAELPQTILWKEIAEFNIQNNISGQAHILEEHHLKMMQKHTEMQHKNKQLNKTEDEAINQKNNSIILLPYNLTYAENATINETEHSGHKHKHHKRSVVEIDTKKHSHGSDLKKENDKSKLSNQKETHEHHVVDENQSDSKVSDLDVNEIRVNELFITSSWMKWKGELACLFGVMAFFLLSIVALTSIPSVSDSLNWSEWYCIHSKLSYLMLFLAVGHVVSMGIPGWIEGGFRTTLTSITFLSIILPCCVIFLKCFFSFPGVRGHLKRIRRGWERGVDPQNVSIPSPKKISQKIRKKNYENKVFIENGHGFKPLEIEGTCGCSGTAQVKKSNCNSEGALNANCQCSNF